MSVIGEDSLESSWEDINADEGKQMKDNNIIKTMVREIRPMKLKVKAKNCLHTAVKEGDENLIKYLISNECGFSYIFQLDENGNSPAHIAVEMKDLKTLSLLLTRSEVVHIT